jgi:hypothetical protein
MRIQIVKWVSIIGLSSAVLFWSSVATFQVAMNLFVCMAAAMVTLQALHTRNSALFGAFCIVAPLFGAFGVAALGPEQPAMWLGGWFGILLVVASGAAFGVSLTSLKPVQLRSTASIMDRNPERLSL